MRTVIQRVTSASVTIEGTIHAEIGPGMLILLGVCEEDNADDIDWLVGKISRLRIFSDEKGVMNKAIGEIEGEIMVISQFTLYASYKKGNRPSWFRAAKGEISEPIYRNFCQKMSMAVGKEVKTGVFGADMKVSLVNDGPVTICMDTKNKE